MTKRSFRPKSRIAIEASNVTIEHWGHLKWRVFLFSLMLFVFVEVVVVTYAGLGTSSRLVSVQQNSISNNFVLTLRHNMGLLISEDIENDTSGNLVKDFNGNTSVPLEEFSAQYSELCELYFIPRNVKAEQTFNDVFHRIAGRHLLMFVEGNNSFVHRTITLAHHNTQLNRTKLHYVTTTAASNQSSPLVAEHDTTVVNLHDTSGGSVPTCPCVPPGLKGTINITFDVPYLGWMELTNHQIQRGGHFEPSDCMARHRTAVIIPFRDRQEHLRILLNYLHPMLQRQLLYYTVFVVEQEYPSVFNKASIMNVGYREATLRDSFDCFIFHDVDMIPENDYNFYTCTPQPRHVGSHCDKFHYEVPYPNLFGGVTAFTGDQFRTVNGFSNEYYGWGGEDDDMYQRIKSAGLNVSRFPGNVARYTMIKHGSDAGNPYNSQSYVAWSSRPTHYKKNGLNTLKYYKLTVEERPLYTWILVELPDARPIKINTAKAGCYSINSVVPSYFILLPVLYSILFH